MRPLKTAQFLVVACVALFLCGFAQSKGHQLYKGVARSRSEVVLIALNDGDDWVFKPSQIFLDGKWVRFSDGSQVLPGRYDVVIHATCASAYAVDVRYSFTAAAGDVVIFDTERNTPPPENNVCAGVSFHHFVGSPSSYYVKAGDERLAKGEMNGAIYFYDEAIQLKPNLDAYVYSNRGVAKAAKGDLDGSIADCTKALELDPRWRDAYQVRGTAWQGKGNMDEAIADFTKALELAADNRDKSLIRGSLAFNYRSRGAARAGKGDLGAAIEDFTKAIEMYPDFADTYNDRGNASVLSLKSADKSGQPTSEFHRLFSSRQRAGAIRW